MEDIEVSFVVKSKADSRLMRAIGWLLGIFGNKRFMTNFWTTLGTSTIWAPTSVTIGPDTLRDHSVAIRHELVHIQQARRWPVIWQLAYLLLPLPFGLAWFRWRWEREAYLVNLKAGVMSIEDVVNTLWNNYGWCWPKRWMRSWLSAEMKRAAADWRRG